MQRYLAFFLGASLFAATTMAAEPLLIRQDEAGDTLSVFRLGETKALLTQNALSDFRPYIHPIMAPDRNGLLTEYKPDDRPHQTGLYWGFTSVNGRDFFHRPQGEYWRRVSVSVLKRESTEADPTVQWQTVYDMLDDSGTAIMRETQVWSFREDRGAFALDLEWSATANIDITIGEFDYGGLFLRMPWNEAIEARAINSNGLADEAEAEGKRAAWVDVGMEIDGRDDWGHIAIFDHPDNAGYPQPWRVDGAWGVGPVRARLGDWSIAKGETAQIKHRLYIYTGEFNEQKIDERWTAYSAAREGIAYSQWDAVDYSLYGQQNIEDVETVHEAYRAEFLTPDRAVAAMTLPDNFQVNVFASEPMITQPMAFCWDDRGRMWIAENQEYRGIEGGITPSGKSRIVILEDTDGDGAVDTSKVFIEGVVFPSAIAVGFDGVWLGSPPNLLYIPDRDGDDRADVDDIEIRLTGWGDRDLHETINSFYWGPDGWLYGLQGVFTPSTVGKPAGESAQFRLNAPYPHAIEYADDPVDINGGVWRYHPIKDRFEVVAHGFSNPWGIDYDAKGQLFLSACVIPHLWHVVLGGTYHRQSGSHFNPNIYSPIRTIGDHRHRSAHGGARIYQSDAFPEEYHGAMFMGNIHEHAVLVDTLERRGSGFVGHHKEDFLLANNAQFVGFSTEVGPEGAVYMLDWHDAEICGGAPRTRDTGRVYRMLPKQSHAQEWDGRYGDIASLSDTDLVDLQRSESAWHARRARLVLQNRAVKGEVAKDTRTALQNLLRTGTNDDHRLRALWALHVIGGAEDDQLLETLHDEDEYIRAWAIQLLCENKAPSDAARARFAVMAENDPSPVVRLYLASALQRMKGKHRWTIASRLAMHDEDINDHNIPKMIWFGIEPIVAEDPNHALELAMESRIPMLTNYIARRLTVEGRLTELIDEIGRDTPMRQLLLMGVRDGLDGRYDVAPPPNWEEVYNELSAGDDASAAIALDLSLKFGDAAAAQQLLGTLEDRSSSVTDRRQAIRGLAGRKQRELIPLLVVLLDDDSLRPDAIRAAASYEDESLAETLLERYAGFSAEDRLEVVHALASRPGYGWMLTEAIENGDVPRRDIPAYVARLLWRVVGNRFLEVWGPVQGLSPDSEAAFVRFREVLTDKALPQGNLHAGRDIFNETCMPCHQLYGEGSVIGPDLTGANRTDLTYLLGNIVTPSAVIQDDYKMTMVFTDDGQVYSGVVVGEDDRQIQLRMANVEEAVTIAKSQVIDRELTEMSMMPEGLLDHLNDAEVVNLFAYLRNLKPLPEHVPGD